METKVVENRVPIKFRLVPETYRHAEGAASGSARGFELNPTQPYSYDPENGFFTHFKDCAYPMNGFIDSEQTPLAFNACDVVKKYPKHWVFFFSSTPLKYLVPLALFLPKKVRIRMWKKWLQLFVEATFPVLKEFMYQPQHWSRPVKEIRRAIASFGFDWSPISGEYPDVLADEIAVILEHDAPYRTRVQDICQLVNKDLLKENPRKEIASVLSIYVVRDGAKDWRGVEKLIRLTLFFLPEVTETLTRFFMELDQEKVRLNDGDKYNCFLHLRYDYEGKNLDQRSAEWMKLHERATNESNDPNEPRGKENPIPQDTPNGVRDDGVRSAPYSDIVPAH